MDPHVPDPHFRPLEADLLPGVTRMLDDAVGAGFWGFDGPGDQLSFVAEGDAGVAGVILCRLEPAGDPDAALAFAEGEVPDGPLLHVRAIAVAAEARRAGLARRLLARAETEAAARETRASYLFAWLPAGRPEPAAVRFYLAAGYVPGPDLPDFYAAGSIASDARCPYCGAPPCRCAARPFTKRLRAT